jgi:hypothetical protein
MRRQHLALRRSIVSVRPANVKPPGPIFPRISGEAGHGTSGRRRCLEWAGRRDTAGGPGGSRWDGTNLRLPGGARPARGPRQRPSFPNGTLTRPRAGTGACPYNGTLRASVPCRDTGTFRASVPAGPLPIHLATVPPGRDLTTSNRVHEASFCDFRAQIAKTSLPKTLCRRQNVPGRLLYAIFADESGKGGSRTRFSAANRPRDAPGALGSPLIAPGSALDGYRRRRWRPGRPRPARS